MHRMTLLLALDVQAPVLAGDDDLARITEHRLVPLVRRLRAAPELRCALHASTRLLHWMITEQPHHWVDLRELADDGRLELLGGGFYDPVLPAIPEHDAQGQLKLTSSFFRETMGRVPTGAWISGRAWDPALPAVFNRAGFTFTLIDDFHLVDSGLDPEDVHGYFMAERNGFSLALFPIHRELQARVLDADMAQREGLLREFASSHGERTAVLAFDDLRDDDDVERVLSVLETLRDNRHWLKMRRFDEVLESEEPGGLLYLPGRVRPEGLDDAVNAVGWQRFLSQYPEVNHLHKRMLLASYRVQHMRTSVRSGALRLRDDREARRVRDLVERASTQLWRSQANEAYWHGQQLGFYEPEVRRDVLRQILAAERVADRVLQVDRSTFRCRTMDYDCDGHDELVVEAGELGAIIAPRRGGAMIDLDLRDRYLGLGTVMRRHEEPYHLGVTPGDIQLVGDGEPVNYTATSTMPEEVAEHLWVDRQGRHSFTDRFLAPGTSFDAWMRGCFRDVGDFADRPYEIMKQKEGTADGEGAIHLCRNGTVSDGDRDSLIRIEKSLYFSTDQPRLRVAYTLINRYFEPAAAHFGVEINLCLPSGARARFNTVCADGDVEDRVGTPRELHRVAYLEIIDEEADLVICLYPDGPVDVWIMPVETVHRMDGRFVVIHQGIALLLHDDHDLWGAEERRIGMRLELLGI